LWECKLVQALWITIWRLLTKLKIELPYTPAISLLERYLKECKSRYNKDKWTLMFTAILFTIGKLTQPQVSAQNQVKQ
jgi:hypothetical protein